MRKFQRARKPEEKEVRRRTILKTARALVRENGPVQLTLNELGRRSGVSKPNLYRYYESREHVLLHLLLSELEECIADLETCLSSQRGEAKAVGDCLVRAFATRPLLCQLLSILSTILEHNLSLEAIVLGKRRLRDLVLQAASALTKALPQLSEDDAAWAVLTIGLYVAALWPASHPSKAAAKALATPEFAAFRPDAERDLGRFVRVLLSGLGCRYT